MSKDGRFELKPIVWELNSNGCWVCVSHKGNRHGRCQIKQNRKSILISHLYWEECFGPIPPGMNILHKCDNPRCINPEHLFLGTQFDNMRDMIKKGRAPIKDGEKNPNRKLTIDQIREIRKMNIAYGDNRKIARKYNVTSTTIKNIRNGKLWAKVL
jgi:hypothetical protein